MLSDMNSQSTRTQIMDVLCIHREWDSLSNTQNRVGVVVNSKITTFNDKRIGNLEVALNMLE